MYKSYSYHCDKDNSNDRPVPIDGNSWFPGDKIFWQNGNEELLFCSKLNVNWLIVSLFLIDLTLHSSVEWSRDCDASWTWILGCHRIVQWLFYSFNQTRYRNVRVVPLGYMHPRLTQNKTLVWSHIFKKRGLSLGQNIQGTKWRCSPYLWLVDIPRFFPMVSIGNKCLLVVPFCPFTKRA